MHRQTEREREHGKEKERVREGRETSRYVEIHVKKDTKRKREREIVKVGMIALLVSNIRVQTKVSNLTTTVSISGIVTVNHRCVPPNNV